MKTISKLKNSIAKRLANRWVVRGERHLDAGAVDEALACARRAVSICDRCDGAYRLMARVEMPGDDYHAVLARFHHRLQPESYLEIGVQTGASLALAGNRTRCVGVDPPPRVTVELPAGATVYPMTSDAFFADHDLRTELGCDRLALAFIDGLHLFEQALRDFDHIERYADPRTVVLIHDCWPVAPVPAARECTCSFWCGDVWKVVACLRRWRTDLKIRIIPTYPSGLALVTGLDSGSTVLGDRLDRAEAECRDMDVERFIREVRAEGVLLPNDWDRIARALPAVVTA